MKPTVFAMLALLAAVSAWAGPTTLQVTSRPEDAKVFLGGYYKGQTPLTITLKSPSAAARVYKITLQKAGYARWTSAVSLASGQRKSLRVALKNVPVTPKPAARPAAVSGNLSGKVICLDPGHPSETSAGTRGAKITEIRANWQVALRLKRVLQTMGARVVMTKNTENEKVVNRRRAEIANAAKADLMVRLHCDCGGGPGLAVYYPDRQGTKFGVTGPSPLIISSSRRAAQAFYPAAIAALRGKVGGKGIHGDSGTFVGGKQGALTGSIFAKIPVFTVEMVVLTQKHDDDFISSEAGQTAMASALAAGVVAAVR